MVDIRAVDGVPESALDERTAARLPSSAPAAPWTCRCQAIVWTSRAFGRPVFGALLAYSDTPVGAYREVQGLRGTLGRQGPRLNVPFIAVDSPASLVAGRRNWALPKTLAEFTGDPADKAMAAVGNGWRISATARTLGPAVPTRLTGQLDQPWPDAVRRIAWLTGRAVAQPALIRVVVESRGPLAGWLRPGRHLGLLLQQVEFTLSVPAESS